MYSTWNDFYFVLFLNGHFHNVDSTLTNVVKFVVENDNIALKLCNVFHINGEMHNVDSTFFNVVNSKVEIHDVMSTKRQHWNNIKLFAGDSLVASFVTCPSSKYLLMVSEYCFALLNLFSRFSNLCTLIFFYFLNLYWDSSIAYLLHNARSWNNFFPRMS